MSDSEVIEGTVVDEAPPTDGTAVVIRDQHTFVQINRHDEDLIVQEIKGELLGTMAYEFEVGGKPARGLSYEGVNAAVQILNARGIARIKCPPAPPPQFEEVVDEDGDKAWQCTVYAEDELTGGAAWGLSTQKQFAPRRNGPAVADTFAKNKALSKAQRNAKLALIPARLKAEIIAALTGAQIRKVSAGPAPDAPALAAEDTSEEARQIDAENDNLFDALLKIGLKPAKVRELGRWARTIEEKKALRNRLTQMLAAKRKETEQAEEGSAK